MARAEEWAKIRQQDLEAMVDLLRDAFEAFEDIADVTTEPDVKQIALKQIKALRNWK